MAGILPGCPKMPVLRQVARWMGSGSAGPLDPVETNIAVGQQSIYKPVCCPHLAMQIRVVSVRRSSRSRLISPVASSLAQAGVLVCAVLLVAFTGCRPIEVNGLADRVEPSNFRDWSPQFSRLSHAEVLPDGRIRVVNVRNSKYLTEQDFVLDYEDRTIFIPDIRSVDFIVVPFKGAEFMAHTMLSFGMVDGTWLSVSAEIRTERGEKYNPVLGVSRQFELTYVVADERDLIRLRTRHRDADVYLYQTTATPEKAQALFLDMMQRVNQLAEQPEFYHTITNNCTTNVLNHVNRLRDTRIAYSWQVLLPGFSDEFAYELGLLDNRVPFEQLKQNARINDLAEQFYDDPHFSQRIRSRLYPQAAAPSVIPQSY